jgi:hypothetical protein
MEIGTTSCWPSWRVPPRLNRSSIVSWNSIARRRRSGDRSSEHAPERSSSPRSLFVGQNVVSHWLDLLISRHLLITAMENLRDPPLAGKPQWSCHLSRPAYGVLTRGLAKTLYADKPVFTRRQWSSCGCSGDVPAGGIWSVARHLAVSSAGLLKFS